MFIVLDGDIYIARYEDKTLSKKIMNLISRLNYLDEARTILKQN